SVRGLRLACRRGGLPCGSNTRRRSRLVQVILFDGKAEVADGDFVAGMQVPLQHPLTVDADAVRAAQIADYQPAADLSDAAMTPGDLARVELNVAFGVTAQQQNGLVQEDIRRIGQGQ